MKGLLWQIWNIIGLTFIVANGHISKNDLTLWSHCPQPKIVVVVVGVVVNNGEISSESFFDPTTELLGEENYSRNKSIMNLQQRWRIRFNGTYL